MSKYKTLRLSRRDSHNLRIKFFFSFKQPELVNNALMCISGSGTDCVYVGGDAEFAKANPIDVVLKHEVNKGFKNVTTKEDFDRLLSISPDKYRMCISPDLFCSLSLLDIGRYFKEMIERDKVTFYVGITELGALYYTFGAELESGGPFQYFEVVTKGKVLEAREAIPDRETYLFTLA